MRTLTARTLANGWETEIYTVDLRDENLPARQTFRRPWPIRPTWAEVRVFTGTCDDPVVITIEGEPAFAATEVVSARDLTVERKILAHLGLPAHRGLDVPSPAERVEAGVATVHGHARSRVPASGGTVGWLLQRAGAFAPTRS